MSSGTRPYLKTLFVQQLRTFVTRVQRVGALV